MSYKDDFFLTGNEFGLFQLDSKSGDVWIQPAMVKENVAVNSKAFIWRCPPMVSTYGLKLEARIVNAHGEVDRTVESTEELLEINVVDAPIVFQHGTGTGKGKKDLQFQNEDDFLVPLIMVLVCATFIMALTTLTIIVYIRVKFPRHKQSFQKRVAATDRTMHNTNAAILEVSPLEDDHLNVNTG